MQTTTFIHSYWIKPALKMRYGQFPLRQMIANLYCFSLSFSYIKSLGHRIKLFADEEALQILSIIPYDETEQITIQDNDFETKFWAQGKIQAYDKMKVGDIHIDGDVFIKSNEFLKLFDDTADINVQSIEDEFMVNNDAYRNTRRSLEHVKGFTILEPEKIVDIANVGVIQFNSQKLKDRYVEEYNRAKDTIIKCTPDPEMLINPDILIEQQLLSQLITKENYKLNPVFSDPMGPYLKINKFMYTHLISDKKYIMTPLIKNELKNINPELYEKVEDYEIWLREENKDEQY